MTTYLGLLKKQLLRSSPWVKHIQLLTLHLAMSRSKVRFSIRQKPLPESFFVDAGKERSEDYLEWMFWLRNHKI